ncbi:sugar kinase [bacterium]|nr:sugar kinase [bacterium]
MNNSLLVVGSVAFDHVTTPSGNREESLGGSATYFSHSASFFCPVKLVAVIGDDFPQKYIDDLNKKNIDTSGLIRRQGKTFRWKGSYVNDLNEAETIETNLNVFETFKPVLPDNYKDTPFVFLANIDPDLQLNVLEQVKSPKFVACDTMNLWIDIKKNSLLNLLKKIDLLILNDGEAKMLSGKSNLISAAKAIQSMGPKSVIVKKGEHGSLLVYENDLFVLPAYPIETVVDPTGAGDTFAGGTIGYICKKGKTGFNDLKKAIAYGTVMASFNVENFSMDNLIGLTDDKISARFDELLKISSI